MFWCCKFSILIVKLEIEVVLISFDMLVRGVCLLLDCMVCFLGCRIMVLGFFMVDCLVDVFVNFVFFEGVVVIVEFFVCGCKCFIVLVVIVEIFVVWLIIFIDFRMEFCNLLYIMKIFYVFWILNFIC